jgi:DNA-binding Lrp family transcriptional regulator
VKIEEVIRTVNQMKADGIITKYAIGGAVGATFYLEPVSTLDVDIFIEVHTKPGSSIISFDPIFSYLRDRGGKMEGEHIVISGWPVQFLPPTRPLIEEALGRAVEVDIEGMPARVFTAEHLAAIALQTGRAKDKARLLQFIEARALDSSSFEAIVAKHGLSQQWQTFQQKFLNS